ncbi:GL17897 [Drosophila persimilis]|uniref:GL17897 n=1 Tax=Drosophila persimilis TaxID=7234 RepID=B4H1U8_DROPE|nr:GL17897 [Drosophila persimilis]
MDTSNSRSWLLYGILGLLAIAAVRAVIDLQSPLITKQQQQQQQPQKIREYQYVFRYNIYLNICCGYAMYSFTYGYIKGCSITTMTMTTTTTTGPKLVSSWLTQSLGMCPTETPRRNA